MEWRHQVKHPHPSVPEHMPHERKVHWNIITSAVVSNIVLTFIVGFIGVIAGILFRILTEELWSANATISIVIFNIIVWALPVFVFVLTLIFVHNHVHERSGLHVFITMLILLVVWIFTLFILQFYWGESLRVLESLLRF